MSFVVTQVKIDSESELLMGNGDPNTNSVTPTRNNALYQNTEEASYTGNATWIWRAVSNAWMQ